MSTTQWADIGVNLGDKQFRGDADAVLERAREAGVTRMLLTGTSVAESRQALTLCRDYPGRGLRATAGIHPHNARFFDDDALAELAGLLDEPEVTAAGEMGLDFNRDFSPRPDQEKAFEAQLAQAAERGLPVFLHQRDAHDRFLPLLKAWRDKLPAAVVHCFTDGRRALYDYLDLDCHIGITGWVCDERRGKALAELVPAIPAARLLVETDAPYLLPRDLPEPPPVKRRNEPCLLPWIGRRLAALRGETPEALAALTFANSAVFLGD
ncbi:TatD family hydrolase [Alcanivorax sp. 521-1]|uniref:TatD family hydrolase n=1 Tax=Alloalcanivorax profundimaris TaxID=2735259 RepID=A0ABS0AR16_9GAMM|nr:TatD family hydrolase [Alloalcanivorax profundimaris]MAO60738.1 hydrolase TatD [Alcanivorax sp.]MAY11794.1 hydrolase TatD [Alcanivorax sp.]MBF5056578.1 TatD family hydrolase [Alloalcanivorax profundimaris]MBI53622.1 hydrolase TatD [Alcanivorax sp.]HCE40721.1 hydrolase TatD [Alcanivorax sp.]|tara:strand:- start:17175 stop:17975 length:801 start_codon:yes stop_codon:yes gene_type:complete